MATENMPQIEGTSTSMGDSLTATAIAASASLRKRKSVLSWILFKHVSLCKVQREMEGTDRWNTSGSWILERWSSDRSV